MNKLRQQFPIPPYRVVYGASGMHLSAAVLTDRGAVVEHGAYWGQRAASTKRASSSRS